MITTWHAMGTTIEVHTRSSGAADEARSMVAEAEARFSRFLPTSELSRLNDAGRGTHRVSEDMRDVLNIAAHLGRVTNGLVDPGVGAALAAWGYDRTFERVDGLAVAPEAPPSGRGGWSIDGDELTLWPGTRLDLGGVVKGWICDRIVERAVATVASAGGDLRSVEPDLVVEVMGADGDVAVAIVPGSGGFATSSAMKRRWSVGRSEAHHLIDPRTGAPADTPITSASVAAATAVEAEAGAKAVFLQGADGLAWADRQPWITYAVAQWRDGTVYGTTMRRAS